MEEFINIDATTVTSDKVVIAMNVLFTAASVLAAVVYGKNAYKGIKTVMGK